MKTLENTYYELSKTKEHLEYILIIIGVLITPIVLPLVAINNQFIIGSIVNAALIIAGINVKGWKKIIFLITLPSIYAMTTGLILSTTSIYAVYMIPFIWLGNLSIIYLYRYLFVKKQKNYALTSLISIIAKASIIFIGFNILILTTLISNNTMLLEIMSKVMGINQIITCTIGSIIALTILNVFYKNKEKLSSN